MEVALAIAFGSLFAALVPLWATWVTTKGRSDEDYTRRLEQRLRDTDQRLDDCQRELERALDTIKELRDENLDLMRRVMKANGGQSA